MFEEYLQDAHHFAMEAEKAGNEREAKRYYRASVFYALGAIESFVNFVGDTFAKGDAFQPYEIAFLTDKKFGISDGEFTLIEQAEYHRFEDKLKFLVCKFIPDFDFDGNPAWSRCIEFKKFRDQLIHPRQDEDTLDVAEYRRKITTGVSSIIEIIDNLCKSIFGRGLRKQILELSP